MGEEGKRFRFRAATVVGLAAVLILAIFPSMDIVVSRLFFEENAGFFLAGAPWVEFAYRWSPRLVKLLFFAALASIFLGFSGRFRAWLRPAAFLLAVIISGPGLGAMLLKDHWHRARPVQIVEFGGEKRFTPYWQKTDQCGRNCSFISGHAAGAFSLMALAWVFPRRRKFWLAVGIGLGSAVGFTRLVQGGHFLSDIVMAGLLVYFTAQMLAPRFLKHAPSEPEEKLPSPSQATGSLSDSLRRQAGSPKDAHCAVSSTAA